MLVSGMKEINYGTLYEMQDCFYDIVKSQFNTSMEKKKLFRKALRVHMQAIAIVNPRKSRRKNSKQDTTENKRENIFHTLLFVCSLTQWLFSLMHWIPKAHDYVNFMFPGSSENVYLAKVFKIPTRKTTAPVTPTARKTLTTRLRTTSLPHIRPSIRRRRPHEYSTLSQVRYRNQRKTLKVLL